MAQRALYLRVGVLVLAGLALLAGFLLFLSSARLGQRVMVYETYIRESVQGLDVGAPVKYRGVSLGRVKEISLVSATYPAPNDAPFVDAFQLVLIRFDLDLDRFQDGLPDQNGVPDLVEAILHGLRIRLASQGLTGLAYLEMDFLPQDRYPASPPPWRPAFPWVPSVPSTVAQVQSAAQMVLSKLQDVDLGALVNNVTGVMADLRQQTHGGDLSETLREARALVGALNGAVREMRGVATDARALLASRELRGTLSNANQTMAELRLAAGRLPATLTTLDATLRNSRSATGDLAADLEPLLRDLRAAVANLRDTTELLRRSPSQAIFGAPPPAAGGGAQSSSAGAR